MNKVNKKTYLFYAVTGILVGLLIVFNLNLIAHLIEFFREYYAAFLEGILNTIFISAVSIFIGTLIAIVIAQVVTANSEKTIFKTLKTILNLYIQLFLAVPALVLIVFIYYGSIGFNLNAVLSSIIALSINLSPFAAKIIISAINNIEEEYIETAISFGYSEIDILRKFKIPIIYKYSIAPLLVQWITTIKLSSLSSVIGVSEILFQSGAVITETYKTETVYLITIICYLVIIYLFNLLIHILSKKYFKINLT